ncbi:MAG: class C beta-lactamase [Plesiomonas sp.]|uniref:class C beta-lactamase n=1 Tax=Plesiomonas sp. TaxID=2486279 RepID=UPI003F3D74E9
MMKKPVVSLLALLSLSFSSFHVLAQALLTSKQIETVVNTTLLPLIKQQEIPGMAVAVIYNGQPMYFNYGLADITTQRPVTENTLFELGSVSKTFTGVLGGYAAESGLLDLNDPVTKYSPELTGTSWKNVTMLQLATYTAGGLPLQVPDQINNQAELWKYYQQWQPHYAAGTTRVYSNASIGLFGALAVTKSPLRFEQFMEKHIFQPLKLTRTFIHVPESMQPDYAWGYRNGHAMRVTPGMLDAEAYGVKSTTHDMVKFMLANIDPTVFSAKNPVLEQAITRAQSRYFRAGEMYQGLGWEMYNWPINPQTIINASDNKVALQPQKITTLTPTVAAVSASWVHKTGSTNGFGAYIAFIPEQKIGIVMLANKNYPNPVRVEAATKILQALQ